MHYCDKVGRSETKPQCSTRQSYTWVMMGTDVWSNVHLTFTAACAWVFIGRGETQPSAFALHRSGLLTVQGRNGKWVHARLMPNQEKSKRLTQFKGTTKTTYNFALYECLGRSCLMVFFFFYGTRCRHSSGLTVYRGRLLVTIHCALIWRGKGPVTNLREQPKMGSQYTESPRSWRNKVGIANQTWWNSAGCFTP